MSQDFIAGLKKRRSIYAISKDKIVPDARIQEIVSDAVLHTPSAFNSQSARVVILLDEQHERLWDIVKETLRKMVPAENFAQTEEKINGFRSGYGSVLFFEDRSVIENLQQQFATYREKFPDWSQHSSGMLQLVVWTSLELEGLGASLQHYNPIIDEEVQKTWNLPSNWELVAQMPFGKPTADPGEKQFMPLEERLKVFK
ncbi:nitroreductase family protein [Paenibacillus nasutitermitis]|uniref:Nitroreductase n=1 Tax=Paenibacillus nasutitermitis TaxID=1652958 RepID=A0A916YYH4_9BACL|nr:nitroreductase family protein [Paenibacillus nasutitermitis]GGD65849.1 nitroreductase [Paenibacillus nasutitermitis]